MKMMRNINPLDVALAIFICVSAFTIMNGIADALCK